MPAEGLERDSGGCPGQGGEQTVSCVEDSGEPLQASKQGSDLL